MRKATSILLDDDSKAFIGKQIAEGHFSSPTEMIEAGLRLLKDHDDEIEAIRAALIESEESGIAEDFDSELFLKQMREKHAARG
jgi:antitoxin ParD1/3/4